MLSDACSSTCKDCSVRFTSMTSERDVCSVAVWVTTSLLRASVCRGHRDKSVDTLTDR